ncbi:MAG: RNA polymerase sigma factor [Deferribacterales bacterium]
MHSEELILKLLETGDRRTFDLLISTYQGRVFSLCYYMTGNREDAEDCTQETFIKVFRGIDSFTPDASLYTWIRKIAVNTCLDHMKKPFRLLKFINIHGDNAVDITSGADPEKECLNSESDRILHQAVMKLPVKLRTVIILRELEELSYSEIAATAGISEGTVKSRISRAREELRNLLRDFTEQKLK